MSEIVTEASPRPKQLIVVRKDLKMRSGKIAAQAAHASMMFLRDKIEFVKDVFPGFVLHSSLAMSFSKEEYEWMHGEYAKICVGVDSEAEMMAILELAKEKGLTAHLVIDNGHTEFHGVKTPTCIAIGPHYPDAFTGVTDHLKPL